MTTPARQTLRDWSRRLTVDAIDPADPAETRYVALREAGRGAVDELQATIELAFDPTTQLISGPNGSGKTTELYRLRGDLRSHGYTVTMVNIQNYVNESSAVDVTEFLIALAIAAHDAYGIPPEVHKPSFTTRFVALLRRLKVDIEIAGVRAQASSDGASIEVPGASIGVSSLKSELKSSRPFVDELRTKLSYHVGELYSDVSEFLAELARAATEGTDSSGAVLIVDGLEKLQGTSTNDREVQESIERLFVAHASKLKFRSHHVVYTVPTYLMFTNPGALPYSSRVLPVPVPHVRPRGGATSPAALEAVGIVRAQLREVVARRVPVDVLFGDPDKLDRFVLASGGHLRDLFRLLNQLLNLILRRGLSLPIDDEAIDEAISNVAHDFASVTLEQAEFLMKVNDSGDGTVIPAEDEVGLMARLLQQHMLLSHLNGSDWYEVHPLAKQALGIA